MAGNGVVFRKIHGRIVPIKDRGNAPARKKEVPSQAKHGLAYVAAGTGIASGFGVASAWADTQAAHFKSVSVGFKNQARKYSILAAKAKARTQLGFDSVLHTEDAKKASHAALNAAKEAYRFTVGSKVIRQAGIFGGGVVLGHGVYSLIPKDFKEKNKAFSLGAAIGTAGVAAELALRSAYYKKLGYKFGGAVKMAFSRIVAGA